MKKTIVFITLIGWSIFGWSQQKIKVDIKNRVSDTISFRSQMSETKIAVNEQGFFEKEWEVIEGIHQFFDGKNNSFLVYLSNNFDVTMSTDANNFMEALKIEGKGSKEITAIMDMFGFMSELEPIFNSGDKEKFDAFFGDRKAKDLAILEDKTLEEGFISTMKPIVMQQHQEIEMYFNSKLDALKYNGQPMVDFSYENHKGGKSSIKDFKGKYVYIDIWATWCGPCIAEIPALKKLEHDLEGSDIVFMSISVDQQKDREKWINMVNNKELGGVQLMADSAFNSVIIQTYAIQGIPRFMVVDRDGNVLNADASRPSDPSTKDYLLSLK